MGVKKNKQGAKSIAKNKKSGQLHFRKLKRCKRIVVEDRISALPDGILSHILTYLTLKEAIATSILSRRWKNMWVSHPTLDFRSFKRCKTELYVRRVDKILEQFNGPKLEKFRVACCMSENYGSHVDDWISFAIRKGVLELELNFNLLYNPDHSKNYYLPAEVFSGEKLMNSKHISSLRTTSPDIGKHFDSLRYLCLRSVRLSDEVFHIILSSCCSLERFLLMYCHDLAKAKNTCPHAKLKSLELYLCYDLEMLELFAPNLVSFKYHGRERTLRLMDARQLDSLRLSIMACPDRNTSFRFPSGKDFFFSQFSSHLPKLQSLTVTANFFEDMTDFTELGVFSNLKQLVMDVLFTNWVHLGYQVIASIIRAAPNLELLVIRIPPINFRNWAIRTIALAPMSLHQNLKKVKVFGFRGDKNTMKFLSYLLEYAVSLQTIYVTACGARSVGNEVFKDPYVEDWNADEAAFCNKCVLQLRQTSHASKCPVAISLELGSSRFSKPNDPLLT